MLYTRVRRGLFVGIDGASTEGNDVTGYVVGGVKSVHE